MSQSIGSKIITATGGSIKRVGNYRIHTFPHEIVTDGLVIHYDIGDPRSHPGQGTKMYDLSGNGYNATFTTAQAPYNNADGGSLTFGGNREATSHGPQLREFTNEVWVKRLGDGTGGYHTIFQKEGGYSGGPVYGLRINNSTPTVYGTVFYSASSSDIISVASTTQITSGWHHIATTYDSDYNFRIYINGVLENTAQGTAVPFQNSSSILYGQGDTRYLNAELSVVRIYNRSLAADEIARNYEAQKVRYVGTYTTNFTPTCSGATGKVEALCVAGGGGGAVGGGGAGGLIHDPSYSLSSGSAISVTVGKGGRGAASWGPIGLNGGNSIFGTLQSTGGGPGGHGTTTSSAADGGSGGGGGYADSAGGSPVTGQGFAGGRGGSGSPSYPGGGGGGAGGKGGDGIGTSLSGSGGPGLAYSISGEEKFYAGGGGGSTQGGGGVKGIGGSGIGGDGTSGSGIGTAAVPNTGSGGGGSGTNFGQNGSNGTVIIRYPAVDYTVELLVVAGGGGGGYDTGGGGGAGGFKYNSKYAVLSGENINVEVGKGGAAAASSTTYGTNGSSSKFQSVVCNGGGAGGSNGGSSQNGLSGGSGGGGGAYSAIQGTGGNGISGQGNDGGAAVASGGGGGGGAATVGAYGATSVIPNNYGGDGIQNSITGTATVYAAGGGGGQNQSNLSGLGGSSGVGGDGGTGTRNPTDPNANTGSGGAGGANTNQPNGNRKGTNGADGIVIIAYKGSQRGIGGTVDTTSRPGYTIHTFTSSGVFIP